MSLQPERIAQLCELLKLPAVHAEWPACAQQAAREEASFGDFLESVLNAERAARTERVRHALLKLATLPAVKTLESYDFAFASGAPKAQIHELASLSFIERAENARVFGIIIGEKIGQRRMRRAKELRKLLRWKRKDAALILMDKFDPEKLRSTPAYDGNREHPNGDREPLGSPPVAPELQGGSTGKNGHKPSNHAGLEPMREQNPENTQPGPEKKPAHRNRNRNTTEGKADAA